MTTFVEIKVITKVMNTLDMTVTNNGGHTIIVRSIDQDLEVDKPNKSIFVQCTYVYRRSEWLLIVKIQCLLLFS